MQVVLQMPCLPLRQGQPVAAQGVVWSPQAAAQQHAGLNILITVSACATMLTQIRHDHSEGLQTRGDLQFLLFHACHARSLGVYVLRLGARAPTPTWFRSCNLLMHTLFNPQQPVPGYC
jgi:hypothetical protein